ncbi:MAG TPA: putative sugar nucleotidyl transferase [Candidatus Eisenbacteria bacterium]|jgi:UDP-N-acetylglucosamine diphosphorylase/glucosamine-1-phosphate N-acetyltransferase
MNLCVYEDIEAAAFGPLTLLRPVFALRCGIFTLAEKLALAFPESRLHFLVRPHLEEWTRQLYPDAQLSDLPAEETLFINGRLCMTDDEVLHFLAASPQEVSYISQGILFAAKVRGERVKHVVRHLREGDPDRAFEDVRFPAEVQAFLARSGADLIRWSPRQILQDSRYLFEGGVIQGAVESGAHLLKAEAIHVARGSRVMAGAVLNAEGGPIVVRENATVEPLAYVEGPAAVGEGAIVRAGAKIRGGTSIGPVCRVGGEVAETVFQGYANKQHDGFLGHSFVGEWVNLGANTNNSDLKNTYTNVRTFRSARDFLEKKGEDSGQLMLGLQIGDFTKTGISTSFTTGASVGIGCNLYGTEMMPAYVPSFVWGTPGAFQEHRIDPMVATAERAMERRKVALATELDSLLRRAHEETRNDRELFLDAMGSTRREPQA